MSRIRSLRQLSTLALAGAALALPAGAHAATLTPVYSTSSSLASPMTLAGATLAPGTYYFGITSATAGTEMKVVVDGTYVGADKTAPYALAITLQAGSHDARIRTQLASSTVDFEVKSSATPTPTPAPTSPTPAPEPTSPTPTPTSQVNVATAAQLKSALAAASAGQTIVLADGTYAGNFALSRSGSSSAPIVIRGSRKAILDGGGSGTVFRLDGADYVRLEGFTVTRGQKGVMADGTVWSTIDGLHVHSVGHEAIHLRSFSSDNIVRNNLVENTGLEYAGYGEGIYIGSANSNWGTHSGGKPDTSDRNQILTNTIRNTTAEPVDIKEGTTNGVLSGNSFDGSGLTGVHFADSWVDVKGNGWRIENNTGIHTLRDGYQVHQVMIGWGERNTFAANQSTVNATGYAISVQNPGTTGNIVRCSNTQIGAARLSNLDCI